MKPQAWQLESAVYPWIESIETRFGDIDMFGHLNNVAVARLFEEVRVRFQFKQYGLDMLTPESLKKLRMVVAQSNFSYLQEGDYPAPIRCGAGLAKLGGSSYVLWATLWQNGRAMAFQECVMVVMNESGPIQLPEALRQQMQQWMIIKPATCL